MGSSPAAARSAFQALSSGKEEDVALGIGQPLVLFGFRDCLGRAWAMTPTSLPPGLQREGGRGADQAHLGLSSRRVRHGAEGVVFQEGPAKGGMSTPCLAGGRAGAGQVCVAMATPSPHECLRSVATKGGTAWRVQGSRDASTEDRAAGGAAQAPQCRDF